MNWIVENGYDATANLECLKVQQWKTYVRLARSFGKKKINYYIAKVKLRDKILAYSRNCRWQPDRAFHSMLFYILILFPIVSIARIQSISIKKEEIRMQLTLERT